MWGTRPRRLCATRTLNHSTHGAPCHRIDTYRAGTPGCQARRTASALGVAPAAALRPRLLMPRELRRNRFACIRACQRGAFAVECFSVASRQAIRAFSSGGERFPDTEEVRSSNLLTPTTKDEVRGLSICPLFLCPPYAHHGAHQNYNGVPMQVRAPPWLGGHGIGGNHLHKRMRPEKKMIVFFPAPHKGPPGLRKAFLGFQAMPPACRRDTLHEVFLVFSCDSMRCFCPMFSTTLLQGRSRGTG